MKRSKIDRDFDRWVSPATVAKERSDPLHEQPLHDMSQPTMDTETIDRLFLELSQFTGATTGKELRLQGLLRAVLDAGRPHSTACDCDQCLAWDAVREELRGE